VLARLANHSTLLDPKIVGRWRSPFRLGLSLIGLIILVRVFSTGGPGFDFMAYWAVDPSSPYVTTIGLGAFHYAPPFAYLAAPLSLLPFDVAYIVWTGLMAGLLVWLTRSWALAWCGFFPVTSELYHGNVHILMAALIVVGLRHPPALAVVGFAKLTTGVAMLWPIFRRDWSGFAVASATLVGIVGVSLVLQGADVWAAWVDHLFVRAETPHIGGAMINVPMVVRLPLAVGLVAWGATTDRRWTMPLAVALAMPLLWIHSLAVLVALPSLVRPRAERTDVSDVQAVPRQKILHDSRRHQDLPTT
jgi:hypothetical protein